MNAPAILLLGPTASGKSALALALAERFPLEIVSVDSALVYRGMDIGTAKPDAREQRQVRHHLIDLIDPTEAYSAQRFRTDALAAMADVGARGKVPLLVGGTMLYARALTEGLSDLPPADADFRAEIQQRALALGWPALHAELAAVDPLSAARLKPNDSQRISRALEVYRLTGVALSAQQTRAPGQPALDYRLLALGLIPSERATLHERIARRFETMLASGLVAELEALRARYPLTADLPSMRCVGYRQAWAYLDGEVDARGLRERGIAATRQLAKRQLTWLRSMPAVSPIDCFDTGLTGKVADAIARHLAR